MPSRPRRSQQLSLAVPKTWGGRRPGAGRKRVGGRPLTPHRTRPPHSRSYPVHVTVRALFRPLRSQHVLPTIRIAIAGTNRRAPEHFRITEFSVQYDHIHLLVEAVDRRELSRGMSSVAIRIARSVNALVDRRGRFWADRWHGRELTSPRRVRTALVYVLANFRKHSQRLLGPGIDPFSSGKWFDGWDGDPLGVTRWGCLASFEERAPPARDAIDHGAQGNANGTAEDAGNVLGQDSLQRVAREVGLDASRAPKREPPARPGAQVVPEDTPVLRANTWLGRTGWRLCGLLRLDEAPAGAPRIG
jgi:putative transposase